MNEQKITKLLKNKIKSQNPNLEVAVTVTEIGKTTYPSGKSGYYAKGKALGINKMTGNSEAVLFTFTSTGNNWMATTRRA